MYHINLLKRYIERPIVDTPLIATAIAEQTNDDSDDSLIAFPLSKVESIQDVSICPLLTPEQTSTINRLLHTYSDVLTDTPGRTTIETFTMRVTDPTPIN